MLTKENEESVDEHICEAIARSSSIYEKAWHISPFIGAKCVKTWILAGSSQGSRLGRHIDGIVQKLCAFEKDPEAATQLRQVAWETLCGLFIRRNIVTDRTIGLLYGTENAQESQQDELEPLHDLMIGAIALNLPRVFEAYKDQWKSSAFHESILGRPMEAAVSQGRQAFFEYLIAREKSMDVAFPAAVGDFAAALTFALWGGNEHAAGQIAAQFDFSARSSWSTGSDFRQAIFCAVNGGNIDILRAFHGAAKSSLRRTRMASFILDGACRLGRIGVAVMALDELGADIKGRPRGRKSSQPLFAAASQGHIPLVRLLRDRRAPVRDGEHVLKKAAKYGFVRLVRMLLETIEPKAFPSQDELFRAMVVASSRGHASVVEVLLKHVDALHTAVGDLSSLLNKAAVMGHDSVIRMLADRGFPLKSIDPNEPSPLFLAMFYRRQHTKNTLLDLGASIEDAKIGWDGIKS